MQTQNAIVPILKWVGGKRQLLPTIHEMLPDKISTYYEPFFGGGALFFSLLPEKAVLNDFNPQLIGMYRAIQQNPLSVEAELLDTKELTMHCRLIWKKQIIMDIYDGYLM